ncbi:hypothetical protein H0O02_01940 [Candidatus Micrarchaeota archaeon]|nr:hypothetical protein [Candidatus Micrarchaeota archaeon]
MGITDFIENIGSEITIRIGDVYNLIIASEDKTVLFLLAVGLVAFYCHVVVLFYKKLSSRDIFEVHLEDKHGLGKVFEIVSYIVKYLIIFPAYTVFWFLFLAYVLIFLGATDSTQILFLAALVLAATRLLAYLHEASGVEIAKLLPLTFLAAVLLQPTLLEQKPFPTEEIIRSDLVPTAVFYLKIVVGVEIALRLLYDFKLLLQKVRILKTTEEESEEEEETPKKKK